MSMYLYPQSESRSSNSCLFRLNEQSPVLAYTPDQILEYGYGTTLYVSFRIREDNRDVKKFFLAIVQGEWPVYYLKDKSGKHYYILNDKKELEELNKGKYKNQLAKYLDAPPALTLYIHSGFNRTGLKRTVKILNETRQSMIRDRHEKYDHTLNAVEIGNQPWPVKKPVVSISLQSGTTRQSLPFRQQAGIPKAWNKFISTSISYSLSAGIPLFRYWPVTYQQELCFNKFVNDYRKGSFPPDFQLIQDYSVISLPAMLRYTFGRKNLKVYVNAGLQLDVALNKNNAGWMILEADGKGILSATEAVSTAYLDYNTIQPGIATGFGLDYRLNRKISVAIEFRYSVLTHILPGNSTRETQQTGKAGITYTIFRREQ